MDKAEEVKGETHSKMIEAIREEYFSDLVIDEIPDDEVGDVDESEIDVSDIPDVVESEELESKMQV